MSKIQESAVLLGLAEVRAPLKNMTQEERVRMSHICYRKLLEIDSNQSNEDKEKNLKCIGVVDSFYALQEVSLTVEVGLCHLYKKDEIILQFGVKDVIVAIPALDYQSRIIIVSQTQSFGKTALVLQVRSKEVVTEMTRSLLSLNQRSTPVRTSSSAKGSGPLRKGADSLGKAMGKKVNSFFTTLGNDKTNQPTTQTQSDVQVPCEQFLSDDEETLTDSDDSADSFSAADQFTRKVTYETRPSFDKASMTPLEAEIQYLIQSEETFVKHIKTLLDVKEELLNNSNVIKKKHTEIMLQYIEEMHSFHTELLEELRVNEQTIDHISSIFTKNSVNLKLHVQFISNIPIADKIYNSYLEIFKQTHPSLGENLRKPRMRLNHYILTFESLSKNSQGEKNETLNNVITVLKDYLKEADTRLVTDSVTLCPFELTDFGYLVMNGDLTLKKGEGLYKRRYHVLLLENILVLTKQNQDICEYVTSFSLKSLSLGHELRGVMIHLNILTPQKSMLLIFKAKSIRLQQKWIQKLKNQIIFSSDGDCSSDAISKDHHAAKATLSLGKVEKSSEKNVSYRNSEMPPLTISMYLNSIGNKALEIQNVITRSCNIYQLLDSEKHLIKNIDQLLSYNEIKEEELLEEVKMLFEFHLRYIYPAINYNKEKFDNHIIKILVRHKKLFMRFNEKMFMMTAVFSYKSPTTKSLTSLFLTVIENFFKFKTYFSTILYTGSDFNQVEIRDMQNSFEDVLIKANFELKMKFVVNFPRPFTEKIIMEGFLRVRESLEEIENDIYIILTDLNTYFLAVRERKWQVSTIFANKNSKLGNPTGIISFQVKFSISGRQKRKFTFTSPDVAAKTRWLESFRTILSGLDKKESLSRKGALRSQSSDTKFTNKMTESNDVGIQNLKSNCQKLYMESDL